jgi:hypothetical protein
MINVVIALMLFYSARISTSFRHLNIRAANKYFYLTARSSTSKSPTKNVQKHFASKVDKSVDPMNNTLTDIVLTQEENELFIILRRVVVEESLGTTVRVAGMTVRNSILFYSSSCDTKEQLTTLDGRSGGWVRDKLLGVSGKEDIDIALDNMAGNDFAIALNKWHIRNGIQMNCFYLVTSICK